MNSLCSIDRSLRGFLPTHGAPIVLLENVKVVVRMRDPRRVKLISGGGSGHEPAHAGYVGPNHLTSAVCGEIFASPSVQQILAGILASGKQDDAFLLIVNNYTGDWLNFSLAREIARNSLGFTQVEILLVKDDVAIENVQESVGPRGLAGCVLVIKISGALAEDGKSLQEIQSFCSDLQLMTVGFTFASDLKSGEISRVEIGKGIHGEPGASRDTNLTTFDDIAQHLVEKFQKFASKDGKFVVMINNLGGTSQHLMNVFAFSLLPRLKQHFRIAHIMSGTFMTSLDQEGISVTLLNIAGKEEILEYLTRSISVGIPQPQPEISSWNMEIFDKLLTERDSLPQKLSKDPQFLFKLFRSACEELLKGCTLLNEMDSELGDGDTGSTISRGVKHLLTRFAAPEDFQRPGDFLKALSWEMSRQMGGSSGALYGIFFQAASTAFGASTEFASLQDWIDALKLGNFALQKAARSKRGDRTMLDPLLAMEDFLVRSSTASGPGFAENLYEIVESSAAETRAMIPKAGRAAYTTSTVQDLKYPDPGAHAVATWVKGLLKCYQEC
ncbi:PTS-dependent dihydroxyacetone kinase 1, dihydroxyacetone-binding subunit DhaK-like [Phlebotomus argentipes]|uniref:PTS-dependent dihydroxyacetone kinase 1, dihydroxyacetone-binding subunit DhaK-like n=1 Tax=Phlebotomus argentipes TaxID=94469 RepID=UPI0028937400|nr:PTS-dependent dihydroxyacetone kinase 1, dihydroxyacetone-binding subunit DhaK-like [Phlebotomus argentipes]